MNERGSLATGGMISAKEKYAKTCDAMKIMSGDINNLQKEVSVLKENLQESRKKEDDKAASADWQQKRADRYKSRSLEVEAKLESLRKEMEELKKTVQEKEEAAENRGFEEAELQAAAQIKTHKALAFKQGWNEALGAASVDPGSELFSMHVVSPLHEDQDVDSPGVDFGVDQAHQIGDDCGEGGPEAAVTGGAGSGIVEAEPITQDNVPADV